MGACLDGVVPPRCFDGAEEELAALIVETHDSLVAIKGFNPEVGHEYQMEMVGKVVSVVSSSFSSHFGCSPADRYSDVFEQVAEFAAFLSGDHIFPDGNKRTTVVVSLAILHVSGVVLDIEDSADPDDNEVYQWIQDVVTGGRTTRQLAQALRERARTSAG